MRKLALFVFALAFPALAGADVRPTTAELNFRTTLVEICSQVSPDLRTACARVRPKRRVLTSSLGGIAEYSFRLPVGTGAYDVIGLHRIVRETAPWVPAVSSRSLMMVHGDIWDFRAAFLTNSLRKLPVFLALEGVDVWGIDLGWTLVPASVTNFAFMKNWGIERDARDLGLGMAVARRVRSITDHDPGKMFLLGWSRGGQIGYAYLNAESQIQEELHQVRGFIPVDIYLKTDVEELREGACIRYQASRELWESGTYQSGNGVLIATIGELATSQPQRPSPFLPGFTNLQAGLAVGAMTFLFFPPELAPVPLYHFTAAGNLVDGKPQSLNYTPTQTLLTMEKRSSPYQPLKETFEGDAAICDDESIVDVPFDDHLDEITVPVFYLGADGGFGDYGIYTTTLLGSQDVTHHVVDLEPGGPNLTEYGHADLFTATNARTLAWERLLSWIESH